MPYPERTIPRWLVVTVLVLGLVPTALTALGSRRRRCGTGASGRSWSWQWSAVAAYVFWFVAQPVWALKTKYLLFLAPVYAAWALAGLDVVRRRAGRLPGTLVTGALWATIVAADAYVLQFALGGP